MNVSPTLGVAQAEASALLTRFLIFLEDLTSPWGCLPSANVVHPNSFLCLERAMRFEHMQTQGGPSGREVQTPVSDHYHQFHFLLLFPSFCFILMMLFIRILTMSVSCGPSQGAAPGQGMRSATPAAGPHPLHCPCHTHLPCQALYTGASKGRLNTLPGLSSVCPPSAPSVQLLGHLPPPPMVGPPLMSALIPWMSWSRPCICSRLEE